MNKMKKHIWKLTILSFVIFALAIVAAQCLRRTLCRHRDHDESGYRLAKTALYHYIGNLGSKYLENGDGYDVTERECGEELDWCCIPERPYFLIAAEARFWDFLDDSKDNHPLALAIVPIRGGDEYRIYLAERDSGGIRSVGAKELCEILPKYFGFKHRTSWREWRNAKGPGRGQH